MNKEKIKQVLKKKVLIERLELEDITPEEIQDNEPIFIKGLGLDSVEALDVVAGIEEEFGIKVPRMNPTETQKYFSSVNSLTDYIYSLLGR